MLVKLPGGGGSLIQRIIATSLELKEAETTLSRQMAALPVTTCRAVAWLCEHRAEGHLASVAAFDTDEKLRALLERAAATLGVEAELADELLTQQPLRAARGVLAQAQTVHGSREIVALFGEPNFEQALSQLLPLLQEPIVRILLQGDVRKFLFSSLAKLDVMLRAATNKELPEVQRSASFALAMHDVFEAGYAYVHDVVSSSGNSSELQDLLQWLLESWHSGQRLLDLDAVLLSRSSSPAGCEEEWMKLLALVHKARCHGKKHGKLSSTELAGLAHAFVAQLQAEAPQPDKTR